VRLVSRVAWFRFRATFVRRWGGLLAIVVLIGVLGGVAMGAVAGARRTQSSFPAYLASTNPEDLQVRIAVFDPGSGSASGYNASLVAKVARLARVKRVGTLTIFNPNVVALRVPHASLGDGIAPLSRLRPAGEQPAVLAGGNGGEFATMNRPFVTSGRLADPTRVDEVVVTEGEARLAGIHVGSVIPIGVFTNAQTQLSDCCDAANVPYRRVDLKVVGIVVVNDTVVQDDVDALGAEFVVLTPAFDRAFRECCAQFTGALVQLDHGSRDGPAVTAELARITHQAKLGFQSDRAVVLAKAERAIKPESIALGVFGAIAALATLLIVGQVIGRQIRVDADDRAILRALGAGPAITASDGLIGVLGAVFIGSLLAAGVAVGLSPLAPLGPARPVDPHPGIAFDWTVLGVGLVVLVGTLGVIAVMIAYRHEPSRAARRRGRTTLRSSHLAGVADRAGLPTPAVTGIRFALEPGAARTAVPARSAILGAVLAIGVAIATVTFAASLTTLVSHPALYGWNWDYELLSGYVGQQDLPQHQTATLLHRDPYVAETAGIYFSAVRIDGQPVAVIGARPNDTVAPPLLSGHGLRAPDQIVLGATTLADLHKHVGDAVVVNTRSTKARLRVVGTATMPTIGTSGGQHPTMGTGALVSYTLLPASVRNSQRSQIPGPNAVLIRLRTGVDRTAALRSLERINQILANGPDGAGGVTAVQRPAEIVNYRSQQAIPLYLGIVLATLAVIALALTLIASVRRRRHELALLKTLGYTRRQLAAVVACQSTTAVGIGILIGVPAGILIGRSIWNLFAHAIHAVPDPTIPTLTITLISVGALVLANLVAAIPARQAARTPTAVLLRAE
jgi:hypothetical protein